MKRSLLWVMLVFTLTILPSLLAEQTNPFVEGKVTVVTDSNGNPVQMQTQSQISGNDLRRAFSKLADAQKNFAELLRQISANPMKFMQNGSLASIYQKIANLQKRLSSVAEKLLGLAKKSGIDIATPPITADPGVPSTLTVTPPPPITTGASVGISSKSPQFASWLANGVRISQEWNFPNITNKYGQKVTREDFIKSIIYIESSGIHQRSNGQMITSSCGALGFMQLMPNTARGLGVNPRDPGQNIQGGSKYFKTIFNKGTVGGKSGLDKLTMAGCAYNMGPYSKKLKQSWSSFLASSGSKGPKMYGLKLKMCLGVELNATEKSFVSQNMAGRKSVEAYSDSLYSYAHGIGR